MVTLLMRFPVIWRLGLRPPYRLNSTICKILSSQVFPLYKNTLIYAEMQVFKQISIWQVATIKCINLTERYRYSPREISHLSLLYCNLYSFSCTDSASIPMQCCLDSTIRLHIIELPIALHNQLPRRGIKKLKIWRRCILDDKQVSMTEKRPQK